MYKFIRHKARSIVTNVRQKLDTMRWFSHQHRTAGGPRPRRTTPEHNAAFFSFLSPVTLLRLLIVRKLSCWQTNRQTNWQTNWQTNRHSWKHLPRSAMLRRWVKTAREPDNDRQDRVNCTDKDSVLHKVPYAFLAFPSRLCWVMLKRPLSLVSSSTSLWMLVIIL